MKVLVKCLIKIVLCFLLLLQTQKRVAYALAKELLIRSSNAIEPYIQAVCIIFFVDYCYVVNIRHIYTKPIICNRRDLGVIDLPISIILCVKLMQGLTCISKKHEVV